ncbi:uncharacterized protein [Euphorbia lathyris]|uniref:uncharacterized protein n=1 Tax=Euphorbia lathyris TaxID=212925 RepID=UPI0033133F80
MSGNTTCTVYIGNLDEKVSDKVLYDILIQAGRVVDLHMPRDRETDKPKGFAFVEYETGETADYAVKLFSGLVVLYNRTLKFAISGQDKPSQNLPSGSLAASNSNKQRPYPLPTNNLENSNQSMGPSASCRVSAYSPNYSQAPVPNVVTHHHNGYGSQSNAIKYDNGRRVFGSYFDSINHYSSNRYDSSNRISYSLGNN